MGVKTVFLIIHLILSVKFYGELGKLINLCTFFSYRLLGQ